MEKYQRVCAIIHMDALEHNLYEIKRLLQAGTKIIAVIKTDAYGHGAVPFAQLMENMDFIWGYAVATVDEAVVLRRNGIVKPIMILGYTFSNQIAELIEFNVRPTVYSLELAEAISRTAVEMNKIVPIHIKLDTGMSRIGFQITDKVADEIRQIAKMSNLKIEGIFTHFARADETDKKSTYDQMSLYQKMIEMLGDRGISIPIHHVSNSASIIDIPEANMDAVRAGIILYGLWPSDEVQKERINLQPVMELKSHVIHVKTLTDGRRISYGGTYEVIGKKRIATVPVGYGDGYARSLSNKGYVLIHGKKAPICGRVCMDQFMVDVTETDNVIIGDEVTLIGHDGDEQITVEELARLSERFNYETVCDLGKRIPRVYYYKDEFKGEIDYFSE